MFTDLEREFGDGIFLDTEKLVLGDDWLKTLSDRLRKADYFVILLSSAVFNSPDNVRDELDIAIDNRNRTGTRPQIVPVVLCDSAQIPDTFVRTKRYEGLPWTQEGDTRVLIEKLIKLGNDHRNRKRTATLSFAERASGATEGGPEDCYVVRESDQTMLRLIARKPVTINLIGPMQTGKSSLLNRALRKASDLGKAFVNLNMETLAWAARVGPEKFARDFLLSLSFSLNETGNLGFKIPTPQFNWDEITPIQACTNFLDRYVLREVQKRQGHLVLALDGLDAILRTPTAEILVPMLRSWHNLRVQPGSVWNSIDLILVAYNYLFSYTNIKPPFNVGENLVLEDFALDDVSRLNFAYKIPPDVSDPNRLHSQLGGHPYLTHRALKYLAEHPSQEEAGQLLNASSTDREPFAAHFATLRWNLQNDKLEQKLKSVLQTRRCHDEEDFQALLRDGLIRRERLPVQPRCPLYEEHFTRWLGDNA